MNNLCDHPNRDKIGDDVIEAVFRSYYEDLITNLMKQAFYYYLTCFGDITTIKNVPLINIFASGFHNPGYLLEVIWLLCEHMSEGGIKLLHTSLNRLFL